MKKALTFHLCPINEFRIANRITPIRKQIIINAIEVVAPLLKPTSYTALKAGWSCVAERVV